MLLAVSPWHLQVSRVGFETNLGLFLVVLGAYCFVKGIRQGWWLVVAAVVWMLSMYAYHAERIFIPLLGLTFGLCFLRQLWQDKKWPILAALVFLVGFSPILVQINSPQIRQRFAETSAFATLEPVLESNRLIEEDGNTGLARLIHNRFWHYGKILTQNYLSHFNFSYLFLNGDDNPRHSIQLVGNLYLLQFPFLFLGIYYLFRKKQWFLMPLLFWLLLAPLPAALTKAVPHSLRSLPMVIPLAILSGCGAVQLIEVMRKRIKTIVIIYYCLIGLLFLILSIEVFRYLFIYHLDYPQNSSKHWQYGYEEVIEYVRENKEKYDQIYITRNLGRPSIYYWFYARTDPRKVQAFNNLVPKDQGEYLEFENIKFGNPPEIFPENTKVLIISQEEDENIGKLLRKIDDLQHRNVLNIYERG